MRDAAASADARQRSVALRDERERNASRIQLLVSYPHIPSISVDEILDHAFKKGSRRVGRSGTLDDNVKANLAVNAYIRHNLTDYDTLLSNNKIPQNRNGSKGLARKAVRKKIKVIADSWRNGSTSKDENHINKISKQQGRGDPTSGTTFTHGCDMSFSILSPSQPKGQTLQENVLHFPSLEEVQSSIGSKKVPLSSWHSKAVKNFRDPKSKVLKRKAPSRDNQNAERLERAFAKMDMPSIARSAATDVTARSKAPPIESRNCTRKDDHYQPLLAQDKGGRVDSDPHTQFHEQPQRRSEMMDAKAHQRVILVDARMASLVAETASMGLQDTAIGHGDGGEQPCVQASANAAIQDQYSNRQTASGTGAARIMKTQARNKRRKRQSKAARASLQDLRLDLRNVLGADQNA